MRIWVDYVDDSDTPSIELEVATVPRVGEAVYVRQPGAMKGTGQYAMDYVIEVRHYLLPAHTVRVLTSSSR